MRETAYWTWFILAAIVLLCLLGLHMVVVHLDGLLGVFNPAGATSVAWENVASRSSSLLFTITYILMLGAALYHGCYGLRTILFELGLRKPTQHVLTIFFWVIGGALFLIGTLAAIAAKAVNPVI
jgi:succinate dehydrogenase / fumarate reductase membrane anchor subunit